MSMAGFTGTMFPSGSLMLLYFLAVKVIKRCYGGGKTDLVYPTDMVSPFDTTGKEPLYSG